MRRRTFLASAIPVSLAGVLLAKEGKTDRLSGMIKLVDKDKKMLHVAPRNTPNGQREITWDDSTKWTVDGKPGDAGAAKENESVVAIGKFEGVVLHATEISLKNK
jgi:hypothetical protein